MIDLYPSRVDSEPQLLSREDPVVYSSPCASAPLTEEQSAQFEQDGFIILPDLFSEAEVQTYLELLDSIRGSSALVDDPTAITEAETGDLRSLFHIHKTQPALKAVAHDPRIANVARYILGGDVYIHQSRLNFKPGFHGKEFYWHSDFETWHTEDGMPRMRAVSCSILLTDNRAENGALMLVPGSHRTYIHCVGETPKDNFKQSLKRQQYGIPDDRSLELLIKEQGIRSAEAAAGSVLFFDCNVLHGSNSNITPDPRSNLFFVYNHIENCIKAPYSNQPPRPEFIASRASIEVI
jgi:ectoine hydroxylase